MGAFSVSIAHEVNQPLTSMAIDIETSRRLMNRPEVDRAKLQTMLDRVSRNAKRIADIITSIRERIRNRHRDAQAVKICLMIEDTKTLLDREAAARRASLVTHCTVGLRPVLADPVELQQVLVNLVANALDAVVDVPEDRRTIDLHLDPQGPDRIRVRIADSGPGISPDDLHRIFDPFSTTQPNGMGIGLQICRSIIDALGGDLRAFNRPEGGAVFEFTLQTLPAAAETAVAG
jgi:C4-dicarboxylate-specific signal transduction histidine kinase